MHKVYDRSMSEPLGLFVMSKPFCEVDALPIKHIGEAKYFSAAWREALRRQSEKEAEAPPEGLPLRSPKQCLN